MERRKSGGEYEERVGSEKRKNERKIGVGQRGVWWDGIEEKKRRQLQALQRIRGIVRRWSKDVIQQIVYQCGKKQRHADTWTDR